MKLDATQQKLVSAGLSILLVSCSATHHSPHTSTSAVLPSNSVLVIKESSDGQVAYAWQPIENFDLSPYLRQPNPADQGVRIMPAAAWQRDCDEENRECYRKCMERPLPRGYGSFSSPRKRGGKSEFCRGECQQAYDDCLELERLSPQEFTVVDGAIDWLRRHREAVLVGTVIVIAGTVFVVVSAGAGLIVLAPVALMVSMEPPPGLPVAGGPR